MLLGLSKPPWFIYDFQALSSLEIISVRYFLSHLCLSAAAMEVIKQDSKNEHRTSGEDRASMRRCWDLLDRTGKTFTAAIRDIEGDLARVVSISPVFKKDGAFSAENVYMS